MDEYGEEKYAGKIASEIVRAREKAPIETTYQLNDIIKKAFDKNPRVNVMSYDSLTVDFAKEIDATVILRGIRSIADFEYEKTIADANRQLSGIDTILLFTEPQHSFISSTVVRDVLRYGKDVSNFLPPNVELCDLKMQKV